MGLEIERKFLLASDSWRGAVTRSEEIVQGYIAKTDTCSVRVRISDSNASLNLKGLALGTTRTEYECVLPAGDARAMLAEFCADRVVRKTRHYVNHDGHLWEIDEFSGSNTGLIVAEIELSTESEIFSRPDWLGTEVTHDSRYYNVCLAEESFRTWQHE